MDQPRESRTAEPPSLAGVPWLAWPATTAVLAALADAGHAGRVVGGTVRNTLMGLAVTDIDIATPARPDAVMAACARAGLHAIPTGLEHGTVTVVVEHQPVEVTTLRRDVETDGRRATVAFTDDWAEDARRRDFTMNALYCDGAGRVYDPVGGYGDLLRRRVRFIGDADKRIAEDYLRILRFFRFHATYAEGEPDPEALAACARGQSGMARLSAERVRGELLKLLVAPRARAAIGAMSDIGLLVPILGAAPRPGVMARVVEAEARLGQAPDAMLRLGALALAVADDRDRIAERLRLSSEERAALIVLDLALAEGLQGTDARRARRLVYRLGRDAAARQALALAALRPGETASIQAIATVSAAWQPPRLPVQGRDLLAAGLRPGPAVGAVLEAVEAWWVEQDFPAEEAVRARLATLLAARQAEAGGSTEADAVAKPRR